MNDNEIIKALECFKSEDCLGEQCPYFEMSGACGKPMCSDVYDFIYRQKAEIEKLTEENEILSQKRASIFEITNAYERGRAESIAEFWIKVRAYAVAMGCYHIVEYGDGVVKEMDGGK